MEHASSAMSLDEQQACCPVCTFLNKASAKRCEICQAHMPRKRGAHPDKVETTPTAPVADSTVEDPVMGEEVAAVSTPQKPPNKKRKRARALACNIQGRPRTLVQDWDLSADKAIELAAAEGLTLIRSAVSNSGWKNVQYCVGDRIAPYYAKGNAHNKQLPLGCYVTAEGAALAYARFLGPARSKFEDEKMKVKSQEALTTEEVLRLAKEEGLTLLRSEAGASGYAFVRFDADPLRRRTPYHASECTLEGKVGSKCIGRFKTADEAALAVARHLGSAGSALAAKNYAIRSQVKEEKQKPLVGMSVAEVFAAAEAEGLALVKTRSDIGVPSLSGYKSVVMKHEKSSRDEWYVKVKPGKVQPKASTAGDAGSGSEVRVTRTGIMGPFATKEEAALNYARSIGAEASQREARAAEQSVEMLASHNMLASEAVRLAAEEGLTLIRRPDGSFRGVSHRQDGKFSCYLRDDGLARYAPKHVLEYRDSLNRARKSTGEESISLGRFATAEAAALAFARCFGPELSAKMAAESIHATGCRIKARDELGRILGVPKAKRNEPKAAGDGQPMAGAKRKRTLQSEHGAGHPASASAFDVARKEEWACARCSLLNGARMRRCEACGSTRSAPNSSSSCSTAGHELVGRFIEVHWPLDKVWYCARVVRYVEKKDSHELVYTDDDVREVLDLKKEEWRHAMEPVKTTEDEVVEEEETRKVAEEEVAAQQQQEAVAEAEEEAAALAAEEEEDEVEEEVEEEDDEQFILEAIEVGPPDPENEGQTLCPICMEELEEADFFVDLSKGSKPTNGGTSTEEGGTSQPPSQPWGMTPCGHAFHYDCMTEWRRETMATAAESKKLADFKCPTCRHTLPQSSRRMMRNAHPACM